MSHFTQIKTKIRDLDCLALALDDLGMPYERGQVFIRGYKGNTCSAHLVVRQGNSHDLGFVWNGQNYELVTDLQYWQQPLTVERFLGKVSQRYAYHNILAEATAKGFNLARAEQKEDGTLCLTVQRWNS